MLSFLSDLCEPPQAQLLFGWLNFDPLPYLWAFKSNVRETWRVILVSEADIFLSESLRILAERLSQSEIGLPLRQICYYSPPEDVGVFSTEINNFRHRNFSFILLSIPMCFSHNNVKNVRNLTCILSKTLLVH